MKLYLTTFLFLLSACVTPPAKSPTPPESHLAQIKERLQMIRHPDDVGFEEKTFDECELGFKDDNCSKEYLTVIQFQLLCRESEGTVGEVPETIPIHSNAIKWKLGEVTGETETDAMGFGKVEVRQARSAKKSRLRLTIEDRFVATPAAEITRVVVPGDWCPK